MNVNGCYGCPFAHGDRERLCRGVTPARALSSMLESLFEPLDAAPDWCPARGEGVTVKIVPLPVKTALSKIVRAHSPRYRSFDDDADRVDRRTR